LKNGPVLRGGEASPGRPTRPPLEGPGGPESGRTRGTRLLRGNVPASPPARPSSARRAVFFLPLSRHTSFGGNMGAYRHSRLLVPGIPSPRPSPRLRATCRPCLDADASFITFILVMRASPGATRTREGGGGPVVPELPPPHRPPRCVPAGSRKNAMTPLLGGVSGNADGSPPRGRRRAAIGRSPSCLGDSTAIFARLGSPWIGRGAGGADTSP